MLFSTSDGCRVTALLTDTAPRTVPAQAAGLELRHRQHARVEDRIRQAKDTGLRNLPCHGFATNAAWLEVVLAATDLICWAKLICFADSPTLARCEIAALLQSDLKSRLSNRVQLTTDGHKPYLHAVEATFGADIDYAMLHKIYGAATGAGDERRYSPAVCTGIDKRVITGNPDEAKVSTSYVERQNLTMRMEMRRFARLTNGFSKKVENLAHAVSLHYMHYNFARPHSTLTKANKAYPTTPAMAAGVTNHVWSLTEIAALPD